MAVTSESSRKELYDKLISKGFDPEPLDSDHNPIAPYDASAFEFTFNKNGKSFGKTWISVVDGVCTLYTNDRLESSPENNTSGSKEYTDTWTGFKKEMSRWAKAHRLEWEVNNQKRGAYYDMKKRSYDQKSGKLIEGYYPTGKKSSYSDSIPQVKILIQHTRQIEEGEQRYRNIAKIFVENVNGERFLVPTIRPGIAKVYARHIAEGGTPYDDKGQHITSLVEEYTKMAGFVRATRNGQFNESAQRLVNEGITHYSNLRETLSRMISQRGYHKYFDSYTPVLNEETDEGTTINELFVQETLDPRIESVMPILARLSKNINEMSEVKELDEWAEKLVNETLEGSDDIEEGKLAKAAMLGLAGMAALNPLAAKAGGVSLPGSGGEFSADQQVQLNKSTEAQMNAIQDLQKFLAKMGMRQVISGELDNVTYDNIMKASQMHDAGKMSGDQADMFKDLSTKAGLMKEGKLDEIGIGTLKLTTSQADQRAEQFEKEIEKLKLRQHNIPLNDKEQELLKKYELAAKHYRKLASKAYFHPSKMDRIKTAQKMTGMLPAKFKNVAEAPGAETLAHNQDTEEKNLKAFGLAENDMEEGKADILRKIRKKFNRLEEGPADEPEHEDMDADDKRWDDAEEVDEGLDANQKRVGQLGPTEKVGPKGAVGKLVGASESVEFDELERIKQIIGN